MTIRKVKYQLISDEGKDHSMKRILSLITAAILLLSAVSAEGLFPGFTSLFGTESDVEMPSLSAVVLRPADEESTDADGNRTVTYRNVSGNEFDLFSQYLVGFGCTLSDYSVEEKVMTAEIAKDDAVFSFTYNAVSGDCILTYPHGTHEEDVSQIIAESNINESSGEASEATEPTDAPQKSAWSAGDIVTFGVYPQTAEGEDETPIEWIILEIKDNKALLLSRYGLDAQPYNTAQTGVTWETSSLRKWLNEEFYNNAFSEKERGSIEKTHTDNSAEQGFWSTDGGNDTDDFVYLLSCSEANQYLGVTRENTGNMDSRVEPTDYAKNRGALISNNFKTSDGMGAGNWWLRSPGHLQYFGAIVDYNGALYYRNVDFGVCCVRPALTLDLGSGIRNAAAWAAGDSVALGAYPQTRSGSDETPIEWIVLDVQRDEALLISKYALDCKSYNEEYVSVTWETCTLREWLNGEFYVNAFSAEDQQKIINSEVTADTDPGSGTKDKVFLLSATEAERYFRGEGSGICYPTDYAEKQGANTYNESCWWWLRSRGDSDRYAAIVDTLGVVYGSGYYIDGDSISVRPCVRVRIF